MFKLVSLPWLEAFKCLNQQLSGNCTILCFAWIETAPFSANSSSLSNTSSAHPLWHQHEHHREASGHWHVKCSHRRWTPQWMLGVIISHTAHKYQLRTSESAKGGETSPKRRLEAGEVNFTSVRWSPRRVKLACYTWYDVFHMPMQLIISYIRCVCAVYQNWWHKCEECEKNQQAYLPMHFHYLIRASDQIFESKLNFM